MATRHGRPAPFARLRCDTLEPRVTPAGTPAIDFEAGFTADRLPGGVPAGYAAGDLVLTDGPYQARAVFAPARVDVRAFHTSFAFRVDGPAGPLGDGFTFALTGDDTQAAQTAGGTAGGGLGYAGLTDSVAIKFDLVDNAGEGANSVGLFTGGADPTTPAVSLDGTGIDLHNGHVYRADLAYDGTTLTLTLTDLTDTGIPAWTHAFAADVPAAVGSDTAHPGFTAGTAELFARQAIESWTYTEGPEAPANRPPAIRSPARASFLSSGSAALDVGAADDGGPDNLTYTWEVASAPAGADPRIGPLVGGGSAAVTLNGSGPFTFRVTVTDAAGLTATSDVTYFDPLAVTDFELSAGTEAVRAGETVQFETLVPDPSGSPAPRPLAPLWRVVSGPGTIDASGRYTAPIDATGPVTVRAEIPAIADGHVFTRATEATITVGGGFAGVDLAGAGSAQVPGGILRLADGPDQAGSAYARAPVDVRAFSTSFWFRVGQAPGFRYGDGLTFVLQNAGPAALGAAGGGLGYQGLTKSVAVKFDLVDNAGEGPQSVGLYTGGAAPTVPADPLPAPPPGPGDGGLVLNTGHVFRADLTYSGGVLTLRLWDTVTGHGFGTSYAVDILAAVGGPTALAGFTAGTGELFAPIDVLKWTYTPANPPEPPPPDDQAPALTVEAGVGTGVITTVAGTGVSGYAGDRGPAAQAILGAAYGLAVDRAGNLFIADRPNSRIRRVDVYTGVITTVAGNGAFGFAGDGGPATSASLGGAGAVAVDGAGNLFIADFGNHRVRRVDAVTGVITTVAGTGVAGDGGDGGPATSAALDFPGGVAVDAAGNVFIADAQNHRVRRLDAETGVITTVAGTGVRGGTGDGGPAASAQLSFPQGLALDAAGNLFFVDGGNQSVRRVDAATGIITTVAGGARGFGGDGGPATQARLFDPSAVAVDSGGNLYIADTHASRVRRVDAATGIITTVAGNSGGPVIDNGPAIGSSLNFPGGVAVDAAGNLYIADTFNYRVRRVGSGAVVEGSSVTYTFTIRNVSPASHDPVTLTSVEDDVLGDMLAEAVAANGGDAVVSQGRGVLFRHGAGTSNAGPVAGTVTVTGEDDEGTPVTATAAHALNVVDVAPAIAVAATAATATVTGAGTITTVAGTGVAGYGGDGGPATSAALNSPDTVAVDAAGNLFIADTDNHRVRRVDARTGVITTVAGTGVSGFSGDGGPATSATLAAPTGVAVDAAGNVYVADPLNQRVRKVDAATGLITTVAGPYTQPPFGPVTHPWPTVPADVAVDWAGNVYFTDTYNERIDRVAADTGAITTVAGTGRYGFSGDGGRATEADLRGAAGVAVDAAGNLFIAEAGTNRVRRVDALTGVITTVAGTGIQGYSGDGGPARSAALYSPVAVAVDAVGNLFIADHFNNRVRRVDAVTGVITTVAGSGVSVPGTGGYGGDGGPATSASLFRPSGLAVDAAGNLFIADRLNHRVRKVAAVTLAEGSPATYAFIIANTSPAVNDRVTVTSIAADRLGELIDVARAANRGAEVVLGLGGRFMFAASGPAPGPGTVATVTVTAHDEEGTTATATDEETVTVT